MATWLQFKTETKKLLTDVTATDDLYAQACAAYVKAMISREVDHDAQLSKSYQNTYLELRRRLLGFATTLAVGSTLDTAVKIHLPVDAQREGIQTYLTQLIKTAHQEIGSLSVLIEKLIREGVIDLQSYVECYRTGEETIYENADVTDIGNISRGAVPAQAEIQEAFLLEEVDELDEEVDYEVGDLVVSNGRIYEVLTDGQISSGELGDGLETTDGSVEELDGMSFRFYYGEACLRSRMLIKPYYDRHQWHYLPSGCATRETPAMIALDREAFSFYVWPQLDSTHSVAILWSGLKFDFADGDETPFDESAQHAVREYVLSKYLLQVEQNRQLAETHAGAYAALRTRLYLDCRNRKITSR